MEFKNTRVMNFENAMRGLRNPLESWEKSDSVYCIAYEFPYDVDEVIQKWILLKEDLSEEDLSYDEEYDKLFDKYFDWLSDIGTLYENDDCVEIFFIGPNDLELAQRMIKAGTSDRKFLRQIMISVDITAPLYWWKEFDTYKVGTAANSTSTMHKLASTPITRDCFEMGDFNKNLMFYEQEPYNPDIDMLGFWNMFINDLETLRQKYNETKDQRYWKELIRLLPESWLQTRTVTMNYENLKNMYAQRKHHRLVEWHTFCDWVKTLPYAYEFITFDLDK